MNQASEFERERILEWPNDGSVAAMVADVRFAI
ncbi:Uncharacterised protein [Yersinia similis]|uniref:Uncharacterized protein n=1 Tax=Yersinia similis TaxID=367190 RepID=A0A0T9QR58_9GAMM|nr:Uncharacterised protein [Yersinia similis]CNB45169.1 Uncharacterised protein [Yersinia similis]CNF07500.1 Uncharacterised protein [Yersinia similis]CNF40562.1 Uncharacterised protein [Yersinia similis]CNI24470.1 Uncharacterised protein [Yersinia similis]